MGDQNVKLSIAPAPQTTEAPENTASAYHAPKTSMSAPAPEEFGPAGSDYAGANPDVTGWSGLLGGKFAKTGTIPYMDSSETGSTLDMLADVLGSITAGEDGVAVPTYQREVNIDSWFSAIRYIYETPDVTKIIKDDNMPKVEYYDQMYRKAVAAGARKADDFRPIAAELERSVAILSDLIEQNNEILKMEGNSNNPNSIMVSARRSRAVELEKLYQKAVRESVRAEREISRMKSREVSDSD